MKEMCGRSLILLESWSHANASASRTCFSMTALAQREKMFLRVTSAYTLCVYFVTLVLRATEQCSRLHLVSRQTHFNIPPESQTPRYLQRRSADFAAGDDGASKVYDCVRYHGLEL